MSDTRHYKENTRFSSTRSDHRLGERELRPPLANRKYLQLVRPVDDVRSVQDLKRYVDFIIEDLITQLNGVLSTTTKYIDESGRIVPGGFVTEKFPSYEISNRTEDRVYDADSLAAGETADVLGTLIRDLSDWGLITLYE